MALILQNDDGTVTGANSYVSVQYFRDYHAARGRDTTAHSNAVVEVALVQGTDYVDRRFAYVGQTMDRNQETEWPRWNAMDSRGWAVNGVHKAVKNATCEYALRALTQALMPDPSQDPSGRVVERTEKVGPLEESVKYAGDANNGQLPTYPEADLLLRRAGLTLSARSVELVRG